MERQTCYFNQHFGKRCARADKRQDEDGLYLHGDVRYGGGGQVKVLLDQNVEFGGQVPPSSNTVHLTGEQRRDLRHKERDTVKSWIVDRLNGVWVKSSVNTSSLSIVIDFN